MKMCYLGDGTRGNIDTFNVFFDGVNVGYRDHLMRYVQNDDRMIFTVYGVEQFNDTKIDIALHAAEIKFKARVYGWLSDDDDQVFEVYPYLDYAEATAYQVDGNRVRFMNHNVIVGYGIIDKAGHMDMYERCDAGEVTNSEIFADLSNGAHLMVQDGFHMLAYKLRSTAINMCNGNRLPINIGEAELLYYCPRDPQSIMHGNLGTAIYNPKRGVKNGELYIFDDRKNDCVIVGMGFGGYVFAPVGFPKIPINVCDLVTALKMLACEAKERHLMDKTIRQGKTIIHSNYLDVGVVCDDGEVVIDDPKWLKIIPQLPLMYELFK